MDCKVLLPPPFLFFWGGVCFFFEVMLVSMQTVIYLFDGKPSLQPNRVFRNDKSDFSIDSNAKLIRHDKEALPFGTRYVLLPTESSLIL